LPPTTDLERKLVKIWQETLGIEKVGVHDNFFDLGGHSLLLVQVQSELRELLSREISVIDMFRYPTISSMVNNLKHDQSEQPRFQTIHDRAERQKEAYARKKDTYGSTQAL
jgi:acyl carrier protein